MYRKLVTFTDFNGEEATEELYFHLTKAEIVDLEVGTKKGEGSLSASLQRIIDTKNGEEMYRTFKYLLTVSHGVKSDDGRNFVKNDRTREEFLTSAAYSKLIEDMLENTDFAIEFVLGILPRGLQEEAQKLAGLPVGAPLAAVKEPRHITRTEMIEWPGDDVPNLSRLIATGEIVVDPDPESEVPSAE